MSAAPYGLYIPERYRAIKGGSTMPPHGEDIVPADRAWTRSDWELGSGHLADITDDPKIIGGRDVEAYDGASGSWTESFFEPTARLDSVLVYYHRLGTETVDTSGEPMSWMRPYAGGNHGR